MKKIFFLFFLFIIFTYGENKEFIIPLTSKKIKIDGKIEKKEWENGLKLNNFFLLNSGKEPTQKTEVFLLCDRKNLYIGFLNHEERIDLLKPFLKEDGSPLWSEDCVEVFIDVFKTEKSYFQFLSNSAGTKTGFYYFQPRGNSIYINKGWDVKTFKGENWWSAEFKIPFNLLKIQKANGSILGMNFTRERYIDVPELSSFVFLKNSFHQPEKFPVFYLIEKGLEKGERKAIFEEEKFEISIPENLFKSEKTLKFSLKVPEYFKNLTTFFYIEKISDGHLLSRKEKELNLKTGMNYLDLPIYDFEEGEYDFVIFIFEKDRKLEKFVKKIKILR